MTENTIRIIFVHHSLALHPMKTRQSISPGTASESWVQPVSGVLVFMRNFLRCIVFPENENYALVPLSQNQFAKIDFEDADEVGKYNWSALWKPAVKKFYAVRTEKFEGKWRSYGMHAFLMNTIGLGQSSLSADHINHDTLDNRKSNLRLATRSQQNCNRGMPDKNGIKGVKKRIENGRVFWFASIQVNRRAIHLGTFQSPELAKAAYLDAVKKYHGEFAFNPK